MNKVILKVGGMSCSGCSSHVEKYLNKQKGVISASVNLVMANALVYYDDTLTVEDLGKFINDSGYQYLGIYDEDLENKKDNTKHYLILFAFLSIILMYISMGSMLGLPSIPFLDMNKYPINYSISLFLITILYIIFGFSILKNGVKNLFHKSPNMDTLVMLGVLFSFTYSVFSMIMIFLGNISYVHNLYFESSAIILFFIKLGRYIDNKNKEKTKFAIKELVQITPKSALIKNKNNLKEVSIDEVKKGDILVCKPGMKIAVDGIIVSGQSHFDEAFITGETSLNLKKEGDIVVAGSSNYDGYIEYKAEKIGKDSTISEIVRLVTEATSTKAPISRIADKVSSIFVPSIMLIALLTFIIYLLLGFPFNESLISAVTVLVVACPCALGLATPLAIVTSSGLCAKKGILIKSSEKLENTHKVDTIIFDKTGTLTYGDLKISEIINYSNYSDNELIKIASSLESNSSHPIGKAFLNYCENKNITLQKVSNFKDISGIGLNAKLNKNDIYVGNNKLFKLIGIKNNYKKDENRLAKLGNTIIYIIENKKVIGLVGAGDIVRDNAKNTISQLIKLNKEIIMLTGDNKETANSVASLVGIKNIKANVMPKDKLKVIKNLINKNKMVMMIGDGINDAPALAISNIGVSINGATDIALDSSDVILMNSNLESIVTLIKISNKTIKIIKQNLFWAFFYNILMIPIAIGLLKPFGISITPVIASIAMTISSLTVVFNSLRLRNIK